MNYLKWCQAINELDLEETEFTLDDIKKIIAEMVGKGFRVHKKLKNQFREGRIRQSTTTPKPVCDMRGDEVELMLKNWRINLINENKMICSDRELHENMIYCKDYRKLLEMDKLSQCPNPDDYQT